MIEKLISSQCEDGWVGPVNTWTQNDNEREPLGEAVPVEFIPYGCTNLRLTESPILED